MGLLPDTQNCGLRMRRECRERFPSHRRLAIPTCITARAVMHGGIANLRFPLNLMAGKTFTTFAAHAQPAIVRIWQEAHSMRRYVYARHVVFIHHLKI